jgi:phosphoribosyl-ATP pyrophosphohydrolase/phosphoribosyl-AMP cyclohydrolase
MSSSIPLQFGADGLVPVIVQDHLTGEVRMVAFASPEAVRKTQETGRATFWSRSRGELWEKGQTSGNAHAVKRVLVDCDADCLVYSAAPAGPSCHTGATSCFFQRLEGNRLEQAACEPQTLVARLEATLDARKTAGAPDAKKSYVRSLYDGGPTKIGDKVREEADELARALVGETDDRVASEAADLLFHVLVGLRHRGVSWRAVLEVLAAREGTSGHAEKASR